jgi:DNA repair protein RadC
MSHAPSSFQTLYVRDLADYRPASQEELFEAARLALSRRFHRGCSLASPSVVRDYLRVTYARLHHEVFTVLLGDCRYRLISHVELFRGTVDGASVHPREVVMEALRHNAAVVIFAHNHPSGVAEPSAADELITRRLVDALALIDVRVLDHLVVGGGDVVSFAERGLL